MHLDPALPEDGRMPRINMDHFITPEARRHRLAGIQAVFRSYDYRYAKASEWLRNYETTDLWMLAAPPTHFEVEKLTKRSWERRVQIWRRQLRRLYENEA